MLLYISTCTCSDKLPKYRLTAWSSPHLQFVLPHQSCNKPCSLECIYNVVEDHCTVLFYLLATSGCKGLSDNHVSQSENRISTIWMNDRVVAHVARTARNHWYVPWNVRNVPRGIVNTQCLFLSVLCTPLCPSTLVIRHYHSNHKGQDKQCTRGVRIHWCV